MQPLKPNEQQAILENQPNAQPEDVEEYERLLSQRFTVDPDAAPNRAPGVAAEVGEDSEARIAELHQKLYGRVRSLVESESR
ncbi:MAG TPA: hypothetical protein VG225_01730 [Terracidiphilus sp.]|jgi:hypothetical protein|nr:hypothetical protein [Terracidiphilus sp.]